MKTTIKLMLVCLIFVTAACRDTKQEALETEVIETEAAVEKIEAIEVETEKIIESIDENAEALKKELLELDNI